MMNSLKQTNVRIIANFSLHIVTILLLLCCISCSTHLGKTAQHSSREIVVYPPPPDTARIQFLTSISNSHQVSKDRRSGFERFIVGEEAAKPIVKPMGIASRNGKIYICDLYIQGLIIIDLKKSGFTYFIPDGDASLPSPLSCYVDENEYLFVADGARKEVLIYDPNGRYIGTLGEENENFKPAGVFVTKDKIWVADLTGHRIWVYSKEAAYGNHSLLYSFPRSEPKQEEYLYTPINLQVVEDKVYVCDVGDFKIKIYNSEGKYLSSIGSYGNGLGQFLFPKSIGVDKNNNLFVVDAVQQIVKIFNRQGQLLLLFGGKQQHIKGSLFLPAQICIDYDNIAYFQKYVAPQFTLKYLIFVGNHLGANKINVYGAVEPK